MDGVDLSRREFLQVGTVTLAGLSNGDIQIQQLNQSDSDDYQQAAFLMGPKTARPSKAELESIQNGARTRYAYVYEDEYGTRSWITQDTEWQNLSRADVAQTAQDYTIRDPRIDTLAVNTNDAATTVTVGTEWYQTGAELTVSDVTENASTNNITIQTEDGTPITPQDPLVIDVNGGSATIQYLGGNVLDVSARVALTGTVGQIL